MYRNKLERDYTDIYRGGDRGLSDRGLGDRGLSDRGDYMDRMTFDRRTVGQLDLDDRFGDEEDMRYHSRGNDNRNYNQINNQNNGGRRNYNENE